MNRFVVLPIYTISVAYSLTTFFHFFCSSLIGGGIPNLFVRTFSYARLLLFFFTNSTFALGIFVLLFVFYLRSYSALGSQWPFWTSALAAAICNLSRITSFCHSLPVSGSDGGTYYFYVITAINSIHSLWRVSVGSYFSHFRPPIPFAHTSLSFSSSCRLLFEMTGDSRLFPNPLHFFFVHPDILWNVGIFR